MHVEITVSSDGRLFIASSGGVSGTASSDDPRDGIFLAVGRLFRNLHEAGTRLPFSMTLTGHAQQTIAGG